MIGHRGKRRRPRVRSVTFHRFRWVLQREVILRLLYPAAIGTAGETSYRRMVLALAHASLRAHADNLLREYPWRRFWNLPRNNSP